MRPPARRCHTRHSGADQPDLVEQQTLRKTAPVLQIALQCTAGRWAAGIADQDVWFEMRDGGHGLVYACRTAEIDGQRLGFARYCAHLAERRSQPVALSRSNGHRCALCSQCLGDAQPKAAGGAKNKRLLPDDPKIHLLLLDETGYCRSWPARDEGSVTGSEHIRPMQT